jgi:hypothetical protein
MPASQTSFEASGCVLLQQTGDQRLIPARYEFDLRLPGFASLALLRRVNTIALEQVSHFGGED